MITEQDIEVVARALFPNAWSSKDQGGRSSVLDIDIDNSTRLARAALQSIVPILVERCAMIVFEEVGNNTVCERTMRRIRSLASLGGGM